MNAITNSELSELKNAFKDQLAQIKNLGLRLDLTRGKPCSEQLDLANDLDGILNGNFHSEDGTDTRNYGIIDGIPEAKELFSQVLGVSKDQILVGGNSSLTLMFQYMSHACQFGINGVESAWQKKFTAPSFICPCPGYDRHFAICEDLGIKMHLVEMDLNGPKMDQVHNIIAKDHSVCGIWCVPKYSNPTGITYSKEVVSGIADLHKSTHSEFRIFWDNAYVLHDLKNGEELHNIFNYAEKIGTSDSIVMFGSTSKITHAGSGVAFLGTSKKNLMSFKKFLGTQTIGPDKVNQLRHVKFLQSYSQLQSYMKKHGEILKPKFELVIKILEEQIGGLNIASWSNPRGGYFISLDTQPGLAKAVINLCGEHGVKLTPAGATYPYGIDPNDRNIRIAPSMPNLKEIELATKTLAAAIGYLSI